MSSRVSLLILFVVLLVAALLRFWDLDARSVWFDEAFSLELATNCGIMELLDRTGRDVHPPGYYLLLKGWMWIAPRTEYGIRSLSALLGICGVGFLFVVTRRLTQMSGILQIRSHSEWISLSAAILLATNAQHIYWSREARMYTFGVALTLSSTWFMLQWIRGRSWRSGTGAAVTVAALMLTHNYGLFTAVSQACCVIWYELCICRQSPAGRRIRNAVAALSPWVVAGWLYLPWFTVLLQQRARVQQEFWIQAFDWFTLPAVFYLHVFPLNDIGPVMDWLVLISAAVVLVAVGVVTCWFLVRVNWIRDAWAIPVMMGLGPVCIAVIVSVVSVSVIDTRHLSYCFPFLVMMFCAAVFWLIPREWAAYSLIFATGWSVFGEFQHRNSLQTDQRGGIRAAVKALVPKISDSETVVVQHPGIYHAVCFYLSNRNRIKLYLPAGLPRHFYGRPLIRKTELISGMELDQLQQSRLMAIDTGGFGGDQGFPLPERWKRQAPQIEWFQDVAWFQGSIGAAEYVPTTPAIVNAEVDADPKSNLNSLRDSKHFSWDFSRYRFDREWFSLPEGAGESARIRPTATGLMFYPSVTSRRENLYLTVRQDLSGDFTATTVWDFRDEDQQQRRGLNWRLLLTPGNNLFDVEPVDVRISPDRSVIEILCDGRSASMQTNAEDFVTNSLVLSIRRIGGKLSVKSTIGDQSCGCETWISDQPVQLHLGKVVSALHDQSTSDAVADVRCVLKRLETSADVIQYHADDGVTDVTIPPSPGFWACWGIGGVFFFVTNFFLRQQLETRVMWESFHGDGCA